LDLTAAVAAAETASATSMMIQTHQLLRISKCTYQSGHMQSDPEGS